MPRPEFGGGNETPVQSGGYRNAPKAARSRGTSVAGQATSEVLRVISSTPFSI
jgi:hypothetical protein